METRHIFHKQLSSDMYVPSNLDKGEGVGGLWRYVSVRHCANANEPMGPISNATVKAIWRHYARRVI